MQSFFKTLLRPDQEEDPERTVVARAANILQIGEFQLLQLAYADWHGKDMPSEMGGALFNAYMLRNEVPAWARHFARWVIRQDEIGMIDSHDPRFHRFDHDYVTHVPQGLRKFITASMIVVFLIGTAILAGHMSGVEGTSVLPPYFDRGELGADR